MHHTLPFAVIALLTLSCAAVTPGSGRSLALRDADSTVVVTWDGQQAVAWRDGVAFERLDADTWDEALWSLDAPRQGDVTSPHFYDRALTADEIEALQDCAWRNEVTPVQCGVQVDCDCPSGTLPTLAAR